jgi:phage terminase large subunit
VFRAAWLRERFFERPDAEIMTCHTTYRDNLFIDAGFKKRMDERRIRDPAGYLIYGEGEWGSYEGQIFPNARIKDFEREARFFDAVSMGQDFGFNHANALLLIGIKDGDIYIMRELYERGKDTAELIELAGRMGFPKGVAMHCDSAEPDRIRMWQKAGFRAFGCKKYPGSVLGAINWLKVRKIFIHPDCPNTARELTGYMWQKDRSGKYTDLPQGYDDDAAAALRYGCEFWIRAAETAGERKSRKSGQKGPAGRYGEFLTGGAAGESYLKF